MQSLFTLSSQSSSKHLPKLCLAHDPQALLKIGSMYPNSQVLIKVASKVFSEVNNELKVKRNVSES